MHRTLSSRWLRGALSAGDRAALAEFPSYLCPALSAPAIRGFASTAPATTTRRSHPAAQQQHRCLHARSAVDESAPTESPQAPQARKKSLPLQCHGCGGFTQTTDTSQAGYYNLDRRAVRRYLGLEGADGKPLKENKDEDLVVEQALGSLDPAALAELGIDAKTFQHGDELDPYGTSMPPFPLRLSTSFF
jgi:genetic interactor of prohibitins 3, mitochondrial